MYELEINGQVCQFNFGFGFLKDINATAVQHIDGIDGAKQNMGLRVAVSGLLDSDVEVLVNVLYVANKGGNPRLTQDAIGSYIEQDATDINKLFADVLGFLQNSNCTKKATAEIVEAVEKEKARQKAKQDLEATLDALELKRAKAQAKAKN